MRPRTNLEQVLADKVPARVVATTLGIIGGQPGALAGAVIGPLLENVLASGNQRYLDGAREVFDAAGRAVGADPDELAAHVLEENARLDFSVTVLRAALETLDRQKLTALARIFAFGLVDDGVRLDAATLYLAAIRDLEPVHVRLLAYFVQFMDSPPRDAFHGIHGGVTMSELTLDQQASLGSGLSPVLAVLQRHGLVEYRAEQNAIQSGYCGTTFGLEVLAFIEAESPTGV